MTIYRHLPSRRYSEAVVAQGLIFTTQIPENLQADAAGQTVEVLALTDRVLADLGSDKSKIVDVTIFLADLADFDAMNQVWDAWVAEGHAPTRATVEAKLTDPDLKIELKIIAAR